MIYKVLVSAPYFQPVVKQFEKIFNERGIELVVPIVHERLSEDELLSLISDIHGAICGDDRFTEKVLEAAPLLRIISKWGSGIDSIDLKAASRLGIAVRNTPGAFNEPVADQVLACMLAFARQVPWINEEMKAGRWDKQPCFSLQGHTLGVIGVGNTGKEIIRRARAFGMRLLGNDIISMPVDFLAETGIQMVDKKALLEESDFVSTNCDLNPTSVKIMGWKEFSWMKPTSYFINAARGGLVDEKALIEALQTGAVCGAALDVFEDEPLPLNSPLRKMDNVLLSPHNANSSPKHWQRVHQSTVDNLILGLKKGTRGKAS